MTLRTCFWTALLGIFLLPVSGHAERALVIGSAQNAGGLLRAGTPIDVAGALKERGFAVVGAAPATARLMREGLSDFYRGIAEDEQRIVIFLAGPFVRSQQGVWMLSDAGQGQAGLDLAEVSAVGLSVPTVLEIASTVPGGAVVLLAEQAPPEDLGRGLRPGLGGLDIPQGVTVIRGEARAVAQFAEDAMLRPQEPLMALAAEADGLRVMGYKGQDLVLVRRARGAAGPGTDPVRVPGATATAEAERAIWEAALAQDTRQAYLGYLERYPLGQFADQARAGLAAIAAEPNRPARLAEDALGLSRDQRREIQRNLTVLEYRPRGIDGIFGPGTRAAISAFQRANGFPETTYLTPQQIARLEEQTIRKQAELEAEAERRRLEEEAKDRAFWEAAGAGRDEASLRTYLKRYPDGLFSEQAAAALSEIEDAKRQEAAAKDRAAWDEARGNDTAASYGIYLRAFPDGAFAEEAKARIDALNEEGSDAVTAAKAGEKALGLNEDSRLLVERRLEALGLEPGKVDGKFNKTTRKAIRRFQKARNLQVTGYLNEATVVRMLAAIRP